MYRTIALSTMFLSFPQTLSVTYSIAAFTFKKSVNFVFGIS